MSHTSGPLVSVKKLNSIFKIPLYLFEYNIQIKVILRVIFESKKTSVEEDIKS